MSLCSLTLVRTHREEKVCQKYVQKPYLPLQTQKAWKHGSNLIRILLGKGTLGNTSKMRPSSLGGHWPGWIWFDLLDCASVSFGGFDTRSEDSVISKDTLRLWQKGRDGTVFRSLSAPSSSLGHLLPAWLSFASREVKFSKDRVYLSQAPLVPSRCSINSCWLNVD